MDKIWEHLEHVQQWIKSNTNIIYNNKTFLKVSSEENTGPQI